MKRRTFIAKSTSALAFGALSATPTLTSCLGKDDMERDSMVRLAVVGGNFGSQFQFHLHPRCKVSGVTDLLPKRRRHLEAVYGCNNSYDSLESLLKDADKFDAVAIFTPAPDHLAHVKACAARKLHVLSACPACTSLEEAAELVDVIETSGIHYMNAETSWYRPETILAREWYRVGKFGRMSYIEGNYYHDRGDLQQLVSDRSSRFYEADGSGRRSWRWGFPPMLYPTHALCFLTGVTGAKVISVSALGWGTGDHPFITDNIYKNPYWNMSSLMGTDEGTMLRCNVFWLIGADGERANWFGENETLLMPDLGVVDRALHRKRTGKMQVADVPDFVSKHLPEAMRVHTPHGDSHGFISHEFIEAILADRTPEIDVYRALEMCVPGIVAMQSARASGERLPVPVFRPKKRSASPA